MKKSLMFYFTVIAMVCGLTLLFSTSCSKKNIPNEISEKFVWKITNGNEDKVINEWHENFNSIEKLASIMTANGASKEAVEIMKIFNGEAYMDDFKEMGKIDIATMILPMRANTNTVTYLVNGEPRLISLEDLITDFKIDIKSYKSYPEISKKHPDAEIFSDSDRIELLEKIEDGNGIRFTFDYPILNGYHAADQIGSAVVAVTFDNHGKLLKAELVRIIME